VPTHDCTCSPSLRPAAAQSPSSPPSLPRSPAERARRCRPCRRPRPCHHEPAEHLVRGRPLA
jgi:hypothetical protein